MVYYRRNKLKGGCYFFTVTLQDRKSNLLIKEIALLKDVITQERLNRPYEAIATVILPDHIHAIWQLSENDMDYSRRWQSIKSNFTRALIKKGYSFIKNDRKEYSVWQRRFWEHTIKDERDLENHVNYIHYNPVKHGLTTLVKDWKYSSFHRYVRAGLLDLNWASEPGFNKDEINFGESF